MSPKGVGTKQTHPISREPALWAGERTSERLFLILFLIIHACHSCCHHRLFSSHCSCSYLLGDSINLRVLMNDNLVIRTHIILNVLLLRPGLGAKSPQA